MTTSKAPYRVGDKVRFLHWSDKGTTVATVTVDRVVALRSNGQWRIECARQSVEFPQVHIVVDSQGRDRHGHVERVTA